MLKMTVSEAFIIVVDDVISLYLLASPLQLYGYQTVAADLYLHAIRSVIWV
jgi:hypothetical protein